MSSHSFQINQDITQVSTESTRLECREEAVIIRIEVIQQPTRGAQLNADILEGLRRRWTVDSDSVLSLTVVIPFPPFHPHQVCNTMMRAIVNQSGLRSSGPCTLEAE